MRVPTPVLYAIALAAVALIAASTVALAHSLSYVPFPS